MITRAIITELDLASSKVQVRIPLLENASSISKSSKSAGRRLEWASIIYTPGINVEYKVGDIVIIGFEDNNVGLPIVLGFLKLRDRDLGARVYGDFVQLNVSGKFTAPTNTVLGKTSYQSLFDVVDLPGSNARPENPFIYGTFTDEGETQLNVNFTPSSGVTYTRSVDASNILFNYTPAKGSYFFSVVKSSADQKNYIMQIQVSDVVYTAEVVSSYSLVVSSDLMWGEGSSAPASYSPIEVDNNTDGTVSLRVVDPDIRTETNNDGSINLIV